jgi:hypothetical protein
MSGVMMKLVELWLHFPRLATPDVAGCQIHTCQGYHSTHPISSDLDAETLFASVASMGVRCVKDAVINAPHLPEAVGSWSRICYNLETMGRSASWGRKYAQFLGFTCSCFFLETGIYDVHTGSNAGTKFQDVDHKVTGLGKPG